MHRRDPRGGLPTIGGLLLAAACLFVLPAAGEAQAPPPPQADTTELVFEREVFSYPTFERRNPFGPLLGAGDGGPRFEELRLLGVLLSPNPSLSVALLGVGGAGGGGQAADTYRVRQGQTLGNSRILEIQRSSVIVEVTEFGLTEQRVLELQRPNDGGSS